ncbi:MAG: hypothetical protein ACLFUV_05290 [Methanomassiliicoccales archaeon]
MRPLELLAQLEDIRGRCRECASVLSDMLGGRELERDPRPACFWMIFNKATLTSEVLDYLCRRRDRLNSLSDPRTEERVEMESQERCMEMTRYLFIGTMSSVEHSCKVGVDLYPSSPLSERLEELRSKGRYIFLKGIIKESRGVGMIGPEEEKEWMDLMLLRNLTVHNNAVSDQQARLRIGDREFDLREGEMIWGELDTFIFLASRVVDRYHRWIMTLDSGGRS